MKLKKQTNGVKAMSDKVLLEIDAWAENSTMLQIIQWPVSGPELTLFGPGNELLVISLTPDRITKLIEVLTELQQKEQSNGQ